MLSWSGILGSLKIFIIQAKSSEYQWNTMEYRLPWPARAAFCRRTGLRCAYLVRSAEHVQAAKGSLGLGIPEKASFYTMNVFLFPLII